MPLSGRPAPSPPDSGPNPAISPDPAAPSNENAADARPRAAWSSGARRERRATRAARSAEATAADAAVKADVAAAQAHAARRDAESAGASGAAPTPDPPAVDEATVVWTPSRDTTPREAPTVELPIADPAGASPAWPVPDAPGPADPASAWDSSVDASPMDAIARWAAPHEPDGTDATQLWPPPSAPGATAAEDATQVWPPPADILPPPPGAPGTPPASASATDHDPAGSPLITAVPPADDLAPATAPPWGAPADDLSPAAPPGGPVIPPPPPPRLEGRSPGDGNPPAPPSPPGPHGRTRPAWRVVAIGATAAVVTLAAAVVVDTGLSGERTSRRLTLSSRAIGGMDEAELIRAVDELADDLAVRPVALQADGHETPVPAGVIGLTLDQPAVVAAARAVDHDGPLLLRPLATLRSWLVGRDVPLRFALERAHLGPGAAAATNQRAAVEPGVTLQGSTFAAVPGAEGRQINLEELARRVTTAAAEVPDGPWSVEVPFEVVRPRYAIQEAEKLAARANQLVRSPLTVNAGGKRTTVPVQKVRSWLRAVPSEDGSNQAGEAGLQLQADVDAVLEDITAAVGPVGAPPTEATFRVVGDRVETTPGHNGSRCCAPDTGARVADAVLAGKSSVTLDLVEAPSKQDKAWADKMGIVEKVATFTTNHPAGQPRVTNIHKAADALRGAIVEPGATFSLNNRLGQRTEAKGYVRAGVIYNGVMDEDVGGGVSQLTTTLFNTAFFSGMELRTYQSHTLYINRYPYGREATISWPAPDLSFKNPSPHGLLIWTSYDDTSITVSFYSTRWATAEQTGQTKEPAGACTLVKTERTRTFVKDGRKQVDYVTAKYQPEEGIKCDGSVVPKPGEESAKPDNRTPPGNGNGNNGNGNGNGGGAPPSTGPPAAAPGAEPQPPAQAPVR